MTIAAIVAFSLLFLCNVVVAIALWYSHQLVPSDRRILMYLVCYWLVTAAVLVLIGAAVRESGALDNWMNSAGTNLWN